MFTSCRKSPLKYKLLFLFFRCLLWTASFLQMIRLGLKWHWITFAWVYRAIKIVDSFFFPPLKVQWHSRWQNVLSFAISINSTDDCECVRAREVWKKSHFTPNSYTLMLRQDCQLWPHYPIWGSPYLHSQHKSKLLFPTLSVLFISAAIYWKLIISKKAMPGTEH